MAVAKMPQPLVSVIPIAAEIKAANQAQGWVLRRSIAFPRSIRVTGNLVDRVG